MLTKGFEIETYTGKYNGEIVGLSDRICRDLSGYEREPDSRNVEYITSPNTEYISSVCDLLHPRILLREYLKKENYTLIPGSSLSLGGGDQFYRSFPDNPYHDYIEKSYGTNVVTASIHINIGITDIETLMRVCRVIRMEAGLYLALSASSPFFNGEVTGYHSTRWMKFPKTHHSIPIFHNHAHYISWVEEQLHKKTMQNVRHLWSSVRPNGNKRPYDLNRIELRICDLVFNPMDILAITALLEARIIEVIENPEIDPLLTKTPENKMIKMSDENEKQASISSLESLLYNWETESKVIAKDWIYQLYEKSLSIAWKYGFVEFLERIPNILENGNEAQKWLHQYNQGMSVQKILEKAILEGVSLEQEIIKERCGKTTPCFQ